MNRRCFIFVVVVIVGLFSTVLASSPGQEKDPCSAPFWFEYTGGGMIGELTVELRAATNVVQKDNFFLKLLDQEGKAIGYVKLIITSGKDSIVSYDFEEPIVAASIRRVELFSYKKDVNMQWMKVSGKVGDESYVFFDRECAGMVIGPSGCKRMKIH